MLHLMQLINHMIKNLEYSETEVEELFNEVLNGNHTLAELLDVCNMECTGFQLERMVNALPKYKSALMVVRGF